MDLFKLSEKAFKTLQCECCDQVLPIYKLRGKKWVSFQKKMDALLVALDEKCIPVQGEKAGTIEQIKAMKADLHGITEKGLVRNQWKVESSCSSEKALSGLYNDLHYYSDRWCYRRYKVVKYRYELVKSIMAYYEESWARTGN